MSDFKTTNSKFSSSRHSSFRPPFSSWGQTNSFYGGSQIIREQFDWNTAIPSSISIVPGFISKDFAHLKQSFIDVHTGEILDVHHHYFAGRSNLNKIRTDFKQFVHEYWKLARKIAPSFPKYTYVNMDAVLDPFIDNQPRWFWPSDYAEIFISKLKSARINVVLEGETPKKTTHVRIEMMYGVAGQFAGCDCRVIRSNRTQFLRIRNSSGKIFIKQIACQDAAGSKEILFEASCYGRYIRKLQLRGLLSKDDNQQLFSLNSSATKNKNQSASLNSRHYWTKEEDQFLLSDHGLTYRELADRFNVTKRSVERHMARLRKSKNTIQSD